MADRRRGDPTPEEVELMKSLGWEQVGRFWANEHVQGQLPGCTAIDVCKWAFMLAKNSAEMAILKTSEAVNASETEAP